MSRVEEKCNQLGFGIGVCLLLSLAGKLLAKSAHDPSWIYVSGPTSLSYKGTSHIVDPFSLLLRTPSKNISKNPRDFILPSLICKGAGCKHYLLLPRLCKRGLHSGNLRGCDSTPNVANLCAFHSWEGCEDVDETKEGKEEWQAGWWAGAGRRRYLKTLERFEQAKC